VLTGTEPPRTRQMGPVHGAFKVEGHGRAEWTCPTSAHSAARAIHKFAIGNNAGRWRAFTFRQRFNA